MSYIQCNQNLLNETEPTSDSFREDLRSFTSWLCLLFLLLSIITTTDLFAEKQNSQYIHEHHLLGGWYMVANVYSSFLGFFVQVQMPWYLVCLVSKNWVWLMFGWCVLWDQIWRLIWLFHERWSRSHGEVPSRWVMLAWAMGNDANSFFVVPISIILASWWERRKLRWATDKSTILEIEKNTMTRWSFLSPDFIVCFLCSIALTALDYYVFHIVDFQWWAHIARLAISVFILISILLYPSKFGCTYAYTIIVNVLVDWSAMTVKLFNGEEAGLSNLELALIYLPVYQMLSKIVSTTIDNLELKDEYCIILRFIFIFYSEFLLTMLLVQSYDLTLAFFGTVLIKLLQKTLFTHPASFTFRRYIINKFLKHQENIKDDTLPDKLLFLSHLSSILCSTCVGVTIFVDRWFTGPKFRGSKTIHRRVSGIILILFSGEIILLGFHLILNRYLPTVLVWKVKLQWWRKFIPRYIWLWTACFGLCIIRSNEEIVLRLARRSDV